MSADWQLVGALALVGLAAVYVARSAWKALAGAGGKGCGSGCGKCATPEPPAPPGRISLPQV